MDKAKLPPGPSSALWQTFGYMRAAEDSILELGKKYGDLFTTPTFFGPLVVAAQPEVIKSIFSAEPDTFAPFATESMAPVLGRGSVLLQHGPEHRRARRLLQPPFHGARMRAYGAAILEVTRARLAAEEMERPFVVERMFKEISIEVIVRTVFGAGDAERVEKYRSAVIDAVSSFTPLIAIFPFLRRSFGGLGPWAKFQRRLDGVQAMLREEIAVRRSAGGDGTASGERERERESEGEGEDILSLLVRARDEDGNAMDEQEIIEQLFTLVIAGYETTATALAWAVNEIYLAGETLLGPLRDELRPLAGDPDRIATAPLLEAVCTETLRRHPLAPMVSRRCLKPFAVGDYLLPEGTGIGACLLLTQRSAARFPEPDEFRPARFLDGPKISAYEYFPFGGGAKRCLGAAFALHEMKLVLGTLVAEADLALVKQERARVEPRQATVGPKGGVPVVLRARAG